MTRITINYLVHSDLIFIIRTDQEGPDRNTTLISNFLIWSGENLVPSICNTLYTLLESNTNVYIEAFSLIRDPNP